MSCSSSYTISVDQGADVVLPVSITGLGDGVTITDAVMQLRASVSSDDVFLELSVDNGAIIIVGTLVTASITAAQSSLFSRNYAYDLFITTSEGNKMKVLHGIITTALSVTR